jgi:hypothetical protein
MLPDELRLCLCCGSLRVWVRQQPDGTEFVACRACRCLVKIDPEQADDSSGATGRIEVLLPPVRETPTH